ncbi:MAG TPA: transcription-repair coupling factor [Candidatus Deferrimicrobiaceae bacterium]|nr:transcription-repair coupling factor [Candidatus Deferrimicrobiaceae bacterium]
MFRSAPILSFEHIALALAKEAGPPCVQALSVPPGARSFLVAALSRRLRRPMLVLSPSDGDAEEMFREVSSYLPPERTARFPSVDVAPYEKLSPYPTAVHERMRALLLLAGSPAEGDGHSPVVVCPVEAALEKTLPPEVFAASVFRVAVGEEIDRDDVSRRLAELGYARLPVTSDPGDFSVRGGIVDVFSPAHPRPARISLDGDRVESIRWFDPGTQRTGDGGGELTVVPCTQVITRKDYLLAAARGFSGEGSDLVRQGIRYHGIDAMLPRLYGRASTVFDYLPGGSVVVAEDSPACLAAARNAFAEAEEGYLLAGEEEGLPAPAELFLSSEELARAVAPFPLLCFDSLEVAPFGRDLPLRGGLDAEGNEEIRRSTVSSPSEGLLLPLVTEAKEWWKKGGRFAITSLSPSQVDRMEELLSRYPLPFARAASFRDFVREGRGVALCRSDVARGFRLPELGVAVVTEAEVFGEKTRARKRRRETALPLEEFSLRELRVNDLAVHVDHGIGVYRGLLRRIAAGVEGDFLVLEYAGGDRLFVPVEKMARVQRYVASEEARPQLARLGGTAWQRAKNRVRDSLLAMAQELVDLYARREVATRPSGSLPDAVYRAFEAGFAHEETADQQRVIEEVLSDLTSEKPMDRLVCGDVGYGKTEVAVRAAFKVVLDGRQAAVLVPTTVLAEQHYRTFRERLAGYPVRVESLSRFQSRKEQAAVAKDLAAGRVDIVIGTHRLLQKDISFRDLGLVVIDEEQRFGVVHKEKLKAMRASVDILTLTATPIPRTLHMALSGIRDISVIATPPEDRLSIRTFVLPFSGEIVREAVDREIRRGGQVFFVHNRVETLPPMESFLREILPHVRIAVAHGQMDEEELAESMDRFAGRRADLLLCTAIIEAGLDIANANTILVSDAHRFGLAQLYQLRGRVGRDRHRAYAYFLVPKDVLMTKEATERLGVIAELTELGSGFRIASHDLEIRGGGNLLGKDQSGHIHQVGYELYTQLLSEAVAQISGREAREDAEPELDLRIPAFLPDDFIREAGTRLDFYRKLAGSRTVEEADELELALLDRFGRLPAPAEALCDLTRIRAKMRSAGVREMKRGNGALFLALSERSVVDRSTLVRLVTKEKGTFSFARGEMLSMRLPGNSPQEVLAAAKNLLNRLSPGGSI